MTILADREAVSSGNQKSRKIQDESKALCLTSISHGNHGKCQAVKLKYRRSDVKIYVADSRSLVSWHPLLLHHQHQSTSRLTAGCSVSYFRHLTLVAAELVHGIVGRLDSSIDSNLLSEVLGLRVLVAHENSISLFL